MKINNNPNMSFKAKAISYPKIKNLLNNSEKGVAFIKIEPENDGDINALEKIANYWLDGDFATNIYHAACAIRDKSKYYNDNSVYGLTMQRSNLDLLDEDKILGLVHISKFMNGDFFIEHLQANPNFIKPDRIYGGIGTAMLDSLKQLCDKISCFPLKTQAVKNFYKKNDFEEYIEHSNLFVWKSVKK